MGGHGRVLAFEKVCANRQVENGIDLGIRSGQARDRLQPNCVYAACFVELVSDVEADDTPDHQEVYAQRHHLLQRALHAHPSLFYPRSRYDLTGRRGEPSEFELVGFRWVFFRGLVHSVREGQRDYVDYELARLQYVLMSIL
jgi:hypothetical protein